MDGKSEQRLPMVKKIRILTRKIISTFYRRVVVLSRSMDDPLPQMDSPFPIEITNLQEKDLSDYQRFRPEQRPPVIRKRIADGDQCFLVRSEGQIVHSGWVATKRKFEPYLRCTLILQPDEIFLYDHYTHPFFRGNGLAQARDIFVLRHYRQKGYQRSLAVVATENKPAFRPFEAIGYLPIGMFKCLWWILGERIWQKRWGQAQLPFFIKMESQE
jgi:GNAT superfamily N-acetyltransferase